jgi:hypothetical protein
MRIEYPTSVTYRLEQSTLFARAYPIPYLLPLLVAMLKTFPTSKRKVWRKLTKERKLATSISRRMLI